MARLLIVEDEPLIAMMLEDFADSLGHEVAATVDSVETGLDAARGGGFDLAILDVNLRDDEPSWPIADVLADAGTPFVLATGGESDGIPDRHRGRPFLEKPFTIDSVERSLAQALGSA